MSVCRIRRTSIVSHPQDFASLSPYSPVKPLDVLAEEIGVAVADLVKLDANENLYGPLDEVRKARRGFWSRMQGALGTKLQLEEAGTGDSIDARTVLCC